MKYSIAMATLLLSGAAFGACDSAELKPTPAIPDGQTATMEQMQRARTDVAAFVDGREAYLDCVKPDAFTHNYIFESMDRVARHFNNERRAFLQRQDAIAAN